MTKAAGNLPTLVDEQARASNPGAHVWLAASAGTGKTQVLAARVYRLLLGGTDPGAILCLTFTKAGAAEMAGRINERLAAWVRASETDLGADLIALGEEPTPERIARARDVVRQGARRARRGAAHPDDPRFLPVAARGVPGRGGAGAGVPPAGSARGGATGARGARRDAGRCRARGAGRPDRGDRRAEQGAGRGRGGRVPARLRQGARRAGRAADGRGSAAVHPPRARPADRRYRGGVRRRMRGDRRGGIARPPRFQSRVGNEGRARTRWADPRLDRTFAGGARRRVRNAAPRLGQGRWRHALVRQGAGAAGPRLRADRDLLLRSVRRLARASHARRLCRFARARAGRRARLCRGISQRQAPRRGGRFRRSDPRDGRSARPAGHGRVGALQARPGDRPCADRRGAGHQR